MKKGGGGGEFSVMNRPKLFARQVGADLSRIGKQSQTRVQLEY